MPQQGKGDPGLRKGGAFLKEEPLWWHVAVLMYYGAWWSLSPGGGGMSGKADLKDSDGYSADCWFFRGVRIESAEKDELQSPINFRQLKC